MSLPFTYELVRLPAQSRGDNQDIRSLSLELFTITVHVWASSSKECLHLLLTGNTNKHPLLSLSFSEAFTIRKCCQQFHPKKLLVLIPTFLTLPSASTSGCENFSLKVFTPANLEESRAIVAILKSSNVRARNHPLQNHVT